jgi:diguanylate cyclase (GGDEF)-like protein
VIIIPVALSAPNWRQWRNYKRYLQRVTRPEQLLQQCAPAAAFILCCAAGVLIGGPGAVMFPVAALLWCALSYSLFTTTLMTLIFSSWTLIAISERYLMLSHGELYLQPDMQSMRIGVLLLALSPLIVAIVSSARNELLRNVQYLASHDQLSGLLNRRAFNELAIEKLKLLTQEQDSFAVLMLDIDHFKKINDAWGHAGGDQVLVAFARIAGECLREGDLFGRIGGEEFAMVLPNCTLSEARVIAEQIRLSYAMSAIDIGSGRSVSSTVSIGGVVAHPPLDLEALLLVADRSLYKAKHLGRDRVQLEEAAR